MESAYLFTIARYLKLLIGLSCLALCTISCQDDTPQEVKRNLKLAGENRKELQKVIDHYQSSGEALKLQAAYFLIANMDVHHSVGGELLEKYHQLFDELETLRSKGIITTDSINALYAKLEEELGPFNMSRMTIVSDLHTMSAEILISNIDLAFHVWEHMPWTQHLNFEQFCEYILPYRSYNAPLENWRPVLYQKYIGKLETQDTLTDPIQAAGIINHHINWYKFHNVFSKYNAGISHEHMNLSKMGVCRHIEKLSTDVMRAVGIPKAIDFTPQYANMNLGHGWNAVLDTHMHTHAFLNYNFPMKGEIPMHAKVAKVFRKTYAKQKDGLAFKVDDLSEIPALFRLKNIKDVSKAYPPVSDVSVVLYESARSARFAYICIFDNIKWIPIHWGEINADHSVTFTDMRRDIAYLVFTYKEGKFTPASKPFLLNREGEVEYFIPDLSTTHSITLERKFPLFPRISEMSTKMIGGRFEGANDSTFSNPIFLHEIEELPSVIENEVVLSKPANIRYARYVSTSIGRGNIAELQFFDAYDDRETFLRGDIIGSRAGVHSSPRYAFDNNPLSFFESDTKDAWVGIDFGETRTVSKIKYIPRNDVNTIERGKSYALVYWDDKWVTVGMTEAYDTAITFKHVPSNALLRLRCLSGGKQERIFSYEEGQLHWW